MCWKPALFLEEIEDSPLPTESTKLPIEQRGSQEAII